MEKDLKKTLLMMFLVIGMRPTSSHQNITKLEVQSGILEVERHKVADSNELYDIITPINVDAYTVMTKAVSILLKRYENARRKYHNNWKLTPMEDLARNEALLRAVLKDLQKLASLIP